MPTSSKPLEASLHPVRGSMPLRHRTDIYTCIRTCTRRHASTAYGQYACIHTHPCTHIYSSSTTTTDETTSRPRCLASRLHPRKPHPDKGKISGLRIVREADPWGHGATDRRPPQNSTYNSLMYTANRPAMLANSLPFLLLLPDPDPDPDPCPIHLPLSYPSHRPLRLSACWPLREQQAPVPCFRASPQDQRSSSGSPTSRVRPARIRRGTNIVLSSTFTHQAFKTPPAIGCGKRVEGGREGKR